MAVLILLEGEESIPHPLTRDETVVGRHPDCHIQFKSAGLTRRHARFTKEGDHYFVEDLDTSNGTFLNGSRLTARERLKHGDWIELGPLLLRFQLDQTDRAADSRDHFDVTIAPDQSAPSQIIDLVTATHQLESLDSRPEVKLRAMLELSRSLARAVDLNDILPKLLETLLNVFFPQADRGLVLLKNEETGRLIPTAQMHKRQGDDAIVVLSETILKQVVDERKGILSSDATRDERFDTSASILQLNTRSVMCVPMLSLEGEPIGVINVDTSGDQQPFTKDDMELLMTIAGQAALSYDSTQQMLKRQQLRADMEIERHRSLAEMVAGMAHEINTPLGIVNSAASLVGDLITRETLTSLATDETAKDLLDDIAEATQLMQANISRANQLIQNFKKLSVRQLTASKEEVELINLIDETLKLFQIQAREADLEIAVLNHLALPDARWNGYPGYLSQVLLNLLTNVQRYAYPDGQSGRVEIELSESQTDNGPTFVLSVRDFGVGIPGECLSRVFEPFYTTGRERGGTGLGLSIVYNLVTECMQGTIDVQSSVGGGTEFTITLPKDVPETAANDEF